MSSYDSVDMAPPKSIWAPSRELVNAKFESYKLSFNEDDDEQRVRVALPAGSPLPGRTLQSIPEPRSGLGYKEARNRARWNHASPGRSGKDGGDGDAAAVMGWMDSEGSLWLMDLDKLEVSCPLWAGIARLLVQR